MKLNEILQALVEADKITSEELKNINDSVSTLKKSAIDKITSELNTKLEGTLTSNKELEEKLRPYLEKEKSEKLSKLLSGKVKQDRLSQLLKLSDITDEDNEDTILEKTNKILEGTPEWKFVEDTEPPKEIVKEHTVHNKEVQTIEDDRKIISKNANWNYHKKK